jgi:ABC-2 type transport system ATP-binding protein
MGIAQNKQNNITKLMEIKDLSFYYSKKNILLKNINVYAGEIIGISGENGSGKSTFLKILVGLLKPKKGNVNKSSIIGYSPQNLLLFDNLNIMENFRVFGKGMNLTNQEIDQQSEDIMGKLNFKQYHKTQIRHLSGGTKQKVNFGISLLGNPKILILDEPYQGMDYASFKAFWDIQFYLRKNGLAIIIVSHIIEDQTKFTKSLHLVEGRLQECELKNCPMGCKD